LIKYPIGSPIDESAATGSPSPSAARKALDVAGLELVESISGLIKFPNETKPALDAAVIVLTDAIANLILYKN